MKVTEVKCELFSLLNNFYRELVHFGKVSFRYYKVLSLIKKLFERVASIDPNSDIVWSKS